MIIATAAAAMYISVGGKTISGIGDCVGLAASMEKLVSELDGQYDSEPSK
jgi:hypothetical protein